MRTYYLRHHHFTLNPDCGTSRNTLALIRWQRRQACIFIYYLETPPSGDELRQLLAAMGITGARCCGNVEPYDRWAWRKTGLLTTR